MCTFENIFYGELIKYYRSRCKTLNLSYDIASGSEIMPCIKIDKSQVIYRFW